MRKQYDEYNVVGMLKMKKGKKTSHKVVSRLHNTPFEEYCADARGCCRFKNCWMPGFKPEQMSMCKSNLWNGSCQDCL